MKTEYLKANWIDNLAAAAVLTATVIASLGTIVNSTDARANHAAVQRLDAIVVTAPRMKTAKLDTIVVTASRETNTLVAAN